MKKQFVNVIEEGDVINDYYIAVRKDLRDTQSGSKFLGMVFKDKTGEIGGVMWNNAASVASTFDLGDVVNVRGTVNTYQNRLQVRVDAVLPLKDSEYELDELVAAPGDTEDVLKRYESILETIKNKWLKQLIQAFLDDVQFMDRLKGAAAGKKWHHAGPGGLIQHCYEMTRIAETVCEIFPEIDRDLLVAGIFVHDIGKLTELSQGLFVDYTTAGKLVGHLQIGCGMLERKAEQIDGFPDSLRMQLLHMILSHHGELETGSPVVPKTLEAIALSHIDDLDAQTDAFRRVIEETNAGGQEWSEYITLIGRQVWNKPAGDTD